MFQNLAVKPLANSSLFHFSFEHFYGVISMAYKSADHVKVWSIC